MAHFHSHSQPLKSLNTSSSRQRFVFKNLFQRLEEVEIDVFRSLDPVKPLPNQASSFFLECLIQWRELNTAEDFISFYEEMMPRVQTLPQILLHKETIVLELLCRLKMQARLSLEPILRLIAALSRDLQEDFLPFLQRTIDSLVALLNDGGDRDPEILQQVFTSLSYTMMYLRKYLVHDIVHVLKITKRLRYYPRDYVQEFMAESVSFLLRNAPTKQLGKGIRKIMSEVVKSSSLVRKSGASALLWHAMKGTSSRFHSRAKQVLHLLMDHYVHEISGEVTHGSSIVTEVLTGAFQRLCEELHPQELDLVWDCLFEKISGCISKIEKNTGTMTGQDEGIHGAKIMSHLNCLVSLLVFTIQSSNGSKVCDHQLLLELAGLLIKTFIIPPGSLKSENGYSCEVVNSILQLMLAILDIPKVADDPAIIMSISMHWACIFEMRNSSSLNFIRGLIRKDSCILYPFRSYIMSALNELIEASSEEILSLILTFVERLQGEVNFSDGSDGKSEVNVSTLYHFFEKAIVSQIQVLTQIVTNRDFESNTRISESELAVLWAILSCCPHVFTSQANILLMDLVNAIDQLLMTGADSIVGHSRDTWQSLIGVTLTSCHKLLLNNKARLSELTSKFLLLAKRNKLSSHVLSAVADILDSVFRCPSYVDSRCELFHTEFAAEKALDAIYTFADNLSLPDKEIRVSTLRLLCHYELLDCKLSDSDQPAPKKLKTEEAVSCHKDSQSNNVIRMLLAVETTPLSIYTSRKVINLISRLQMDLSAGRIPEAYLSFLLNGVIGIFHNRFQVLWDSAGDCLMSLIERYPNLVWDEFVQYIKNYQLEFLTSHEEPRRFSSESTDNKSSGLCAQFCSFLGRNTDSTPPVTVLTLLLQSVQKVPAIAASHSRQLIPLFFKFLGNVNEDIFSSQAFESRICNGKEWRVVLKEWLNLLKLMRDPRSLYGSQVLKEVLVTRILNEIDPDIQLKVVECLSNWKDDFLLPYYQKLKNLISSTSKNGKKTENSKNLREELATWSLSKESCFIPEAHREYLIHLVIRVLTPKVMKVKVLASRKHAGAFQRRAILCFLAQLDVDELPLFFSLLLRPMLSISSSGTEGFDSRVWSSCDSFVRDVQASDFAKSFNINNTINLPWKKRCGFLHVIEDVLKTFDVFRIKPFLSLLMAFVVRILECCSSLVTVNGDESSTNKIATKQSKDLRSLCLKVLSFVFNKYDSHDLGSEFWDIFFASVKPLIDCFKQEGSSSEKPSSLFSCFFAMSKSPTLVSLLEREGNLVPGIFSILSVRNASDSMVSAVLSFIENLLNLENELDGNESHTLKRILVPHLDELLLGLHGLIQSCKDGHRKSVMWPGKSELQLLKLLVKYIKEPLAASQFLDVVLPLLRKKALNPDECVEGLHIIQELLPVLDSAATVKILNAVTSLLVSAALDIRLSICDILDGLASNDHSVATLAELIRDLNAISSLEIGELDYETRFAAYERITPGLFSELSGDHALVVLSHCVHDMISEELILRQSASKSLLSFIQFSDSVFEHKSKNQIPILRIIRKFFLMHLREAMSKEISIQKEWIALLRDMVLKLPGVPELNACKPLCSQDLEVDFFHNILHLQKHRRARALLRFKNVMCAEVFSEGITMKVFVPLFFNMLLDASDVTGEHVKNACIEALASIAGYMHWESYLTFLLRCFREMILKQDKHKVLSRLISSVLDMFHFYNGNQPENHSTVALDHDKVTFSVSPEIQTCLQKKVLPKIHTFVDSDSEKINVTIILAAVKLLKLLPKEIMESQLPSIIHRISNLLKNRLDSIREEARFALAACSKELGPNYLHLIIKILRTTLKRGFELHVLGYTLNFILSKTLLKPGIGELDYCLEELLSIAENDIFGAVAEEKDVNKIASKMKETKKRKSFETLKLIAQAITFKTHGLSLLSPVKNHLQKHMTPVMKSRLEAMLHHIGLGIESNPSVDQKDLFVFVYALIEDGMAEENLQSEKLSDHEMGGKRKLLGSSYLIAVFAIGILHSRMKKMKLDKNDVDLLSMLDPFIGLLRNCLSSKYEDILSGAVKCLSSLMRLPLSSIEIHEDKIKIFVLDIIQRSGKTDSPLMHSSLKLLMVLLQSSRVSLSDGQLRMLIQCPLFVDLESTPSIVALSLVKAIIARKLVVPEIYDLIAHVAELMVTCQMLPIRQKCSQILLQFLLDYPIGSKRLQQQLDFLVANLSYEHSSGREAVLEMIHAIINKFPKRILNDQAETFFLPLVVRLANDQDNQVRTLVGTVIKELIGHINQSARDRFLEYCLSWYMGEKQYLWSAAAQVLGLLVEVLENGFKGHVNAILPVAKNVMMLALGTDAKKGLPSSGVTSIPFFKEAYYSLVLLEKLLKQFPEICLQNNLEEIWEAVCSFLLHPHLWLQNISNRLVAWYFSAASEAIKVQQTNQGGALLLLKPSSLFNIAVSLCGQLKEHLVDDTTGDDIIIQNLVFATCGVHSFARQTRGTDLHAFWSNLDLSEQSHFLKSLQLLGSLKEMNILQSLTSNNATEICCLGNQDGHEGLQSLLVSPLLKRMGKIALQMQYFQMKVVFSCFKRVALQIGPEGCNDYAIHMLLPVYKICEGFAGKVITDEARQLAEEVRDSIRRILGVDNFLQMYNLIRKKMKTKRDKRKQEEKIIAVVNPVRNAKRKLRLAAKHRAHKKRKLMTMKTGKWRK